VQLFVLRVLGAVVGHGVPFEVGMFPTGYPECPDINGSFGCSERPGNEIADAQRNGEQALKE
jgi:hypothetical protein